MAFSWNEHEQELNAKIEERVKKHNDFYNNRYGQFFRQAEGDDFDKLWTWVLWWNEYSNKIEVYEAGNIAEAQDIIDFYHFSEARTKVIMRHTGEDVTGHIKFNPLYRDILDDDRLKNNN